MGLKRGPNGGVLRMPNSQALMAAPVGECCCNDCEDCRCDLYLPTTANFRLNHAGLGWTLDEPITNFNQSLVDGCTWLQGENVNVPIPGGFFIQWELAIRGFTLVNPGNGCTQISWTSEIFFQVRGGANQAVVSSNSFLVREQTPLGFNCGGTLSLSYAIHDFNSDANGGPPAVEVDLEVEIEPTP